MERTLMGTRCDFYTMDQNKKMSWVGSYGWDGYPYGVPKDMGINEATSKEDYIERIIDYLKKRDGYISGEDGWPWPWDTSATTDYYYVYYNDKVYVGTLGERLLEYNIYIKYQDDIENEEEGYEKYFLDIDFELPDMSEIKKVDYGKGSGIIMLGCSPQQQMSKDEFVGKLNELCSEYGGVESYKIKYKGDEE